MGKHLRPEEIKTIVGLLDGWRGRLSWEDLGEACKSRIGRAPSRQTLFRAADIALAFKVNKKRLAEPKAAPAKDPSIAAALERIERLSAENARLAAANELLLEQFVRWQYNAYAHGVPLDHLNLPLPTVDHGNTTEAPSFKRRDA